MAKRNYDDLETDYLEEENESGFLSLVSVVIAFIAVAVFIALAWYAYQSNTGEGADEIEVVYPEDGAVREAPEETGGWKFPHQDKSVYNIVSGEGEGEEGEAKVEQILPAPEEPMERPEAETKTWMNEKLKKGEIAKTDAERLKEAEAEVAVEQTKEAAIEEETPKEVAQAEVETPAAAAAAPTEAEIKAQEAKELADAQAAIEAEEAAAKALAEKEAAAKTAAAEAVAKKAAEEKKKAIELARKLQQKAAAALAAPRPQTAAPVVASGSTKIQLGAVRSEADARAQWQKIRAKFGVLASRGLNIEPVSIAGKGTLYRIQATGFASRAEAQAACGQLSGGGQACFAVGK